MPYVQVPKDLSKVKTKLAFNLTKRQLVCFSGAAAVGIPVYLLTRPVIGSSPALFLMIGLMLPFFFFAMFERDGLPFEKDTAKLYPGPVPLAPSPALQDRKFLCRMERPRRFGPSWPEAGGHTERRYQDCEKEKR